MQGGARRERAGGAGMDGAPDRLMIIAALASLAGATVCARAGWRLLQALRARFTYGAPYRSGTVQMRLMNLLLDIPLLLLGAGLGFVALGQAAFQPDDTTVRVGQVEAHRSGWGKVAVRLIPDPLYPQDRVLEGEVSGARWAITGDFLTWERGLRFLGFRDGHRVRALIGSGDTSGTTPRGRTERVVLDPLPGAAFRLLATARFIPFLTVRTESSPWFPIADRQVLILYATGSGYLGDVVSAGGARAPSAPARAGASPGPVDSRPEDR